MNGFRHVIATAMNRYQSRSNCYHKLASVFCNVLIYGTLRNWTAQEKCYHHTPHKLGAFSRCRGGSRGVCCQHLQHFQPIAVQIERDEGKSLDQRMGSFAAAALPLGEFPQFWPKPRESLRLHFAGPWRIAVKSFVIRGCVAVALISGYVYLANVAEITSRPQRIAMSLQQLGDDPTIRTTLDQDHTWRALGYSLGWIVVGGIVIALFEQELRQIPARIQLARLQGSLRSRGNLRRGTTAGVALFVLATTGGCWRPFEPVQLETINPNEEAFLLPLLGDVKAQTSTNNEEYLRSNLVYTKQVKIPQQWVPKGFETFFPNGSWKPAAILVKVDKSPVTREWTADSNSGTSNKNEAIWVMTSDQVEFSTGWTCTARIAARDDAVKFLHNYPNGSLQTVMDTEVRAKLQAAFGLEVTDLPMDTLRKQATPHIVSVTTDVTSFFKERGITITNLGITGGFVYKDKTIMDTMVKVFNAEQEKAIASAAFQAQDMKNKTVESEAEGRAKALLTTKQAEADGIKAVADAKVYEIEKAKDDGEIYLALKRLELEKEKLTKWDGRFPTYFMGTGSTSPDLLLQLPTELTAKRGDGK